MKLLLACALLLFAFAVQAVACSCAGPQRPCEAYGDASAFVGTVTFSTTTKIKEFGSEFTRRLGRLHVDRPLKNVEASDVEIMTGLGEADCGFGFRLGPYAHELAMELSSHPECLNKSVIHLHLRGGYEQEVIRRFSGTPHIHRWSCSRQTLAPGLKEEAHACNQNRAPSQQPETVWSI